MSQLELAKWLKAEEVTQDGVYYAAVPILKHARLVMVSTVDGIKLMMNMHGDGFVPISRPWIFHGPFTCPPLP